jgi:hypothetical protein
MTTTYRFLGRVVDQSTRLGLPALRVEAWDAEAHCTDLVGFALTDAQGNFTISLDDDYLTELFQDRAPPVAFRLFTTGTPAHRLSSRYFLWEPVNETTTGRIEALSGVFTLDTSGPTDQRTPALSVVRGIAQTSAGVPIGATTVKAFDQGVMTEVLLGTTTTDAGGQYQIAYDPVATGSPGRPSPDVVVRAYASHGTTVLVESDRVCHAPATARVDLVSGGAFRGPTELDALNARIAPHTGRDFDITTATSDQLDHLACTSGSERDTLTSLATATERALDASARHHARQRHRSPARHPARHAQVRRRHEPQLRRRDAPWLRRRGHPRRGRTACAKLPPRHRRVHLANAQLATSSRRVAPGTCPTKIDTAPPFSGTQRNRHLYSRRSHRARRAKREAPSAVRSAASAAGDIVVVT